MLKPYRETNVCVTDVLHVLQLCFLCFTLLKAMLLYHIFTGVSCAGSLARSVHNPKLSFLHWSLSSLPLSYFISIYLPAFLSLPLVLLHHIHPSYSTSCIQRPLGAGGLLVCWTFKEVVDHKLNTEGKCVCCCVGGVHAHAWPLPCLLLFLCRSLSLLQKVSWTGV